MKLYHGTRLGLLPEILKRGIVPRGKENSSSNWEEESIPGHIYLTEAYAPYYALCAANKNNDKVLVLEVETEKFIDRSFYPDEDYIFQLNKIRKKALTLSEIRNNIEHYRSLTWDSLSKLGNVAYKGCIPATAITRYVIFNQDERPYITSKVDPTITVINYHLLGKFYRDFTKWMFEDVPDFGKPFVLPPEMVNEKEELLHIMEVSNRDGIEVVMKEAV